MKKEMECGESLFWSAAACRRFAVGGADSRFHRPPPTHPKAVASHRTPQVLAMAVLVVYASGCGDGDGSGMRTPSPSVTPLPSATSAPTPPTSTFLPTAAPTATRTIAPPTRALPTVTTTPAALCADRTGGALVSFRICDNETLRVWSTASEFIDQAAALLASGEQRIPVFGALLDGTDCDAQWTWHPDAANQSFTELAIELCDGCPSHVEADKPYWFETVRQYCPWSARVVVVDDRRE